MATERPATRRERGELLWAPHAWIGGRWRERVVLEIARGHVTAPGYWRSISFDQPCPRNAKPLPGPVLPGLVNAHSHAFQRAFVGMAETRSGPQDDFWSWREGMYRVAGRITAVQLRTIATHLYRELLAGGYTHVCEFHYLQHAPNGTPYADPALLAWALADAAQDSGIGLTLLPALYERAGFAEPGLREEQRRFATTVHDVLQLQRAISGSRRPLVDCGVAVHSLRAARTESIAQLARAATGGPVHIHIAEQRAEVEDCLSLTGMRPIDWLTTNVALDARWQLVHATHATPAEIDAVAKSGAGVVLCPGTEANLGDGLPDLPRWLASGTKLSLGSDSQVTRSWTEELRWLEYGQRLIHRRRNLAADPAQAAQGLHSTATRLFERMLAGGAAAAGQPRWGLTPGARADLLVVDRHDPALLGLADEQLLDAIIFAAPATPFSAVMVAGHWRITDSRLRDDGGGPARFAEAMTALRAPVATAETGGP